MLFRPKPCHHYNSGYCSRGDDCKFLHICQGCITGDCDRGCPDGLNHQLYDPQVRRVLIKADIDPDQRKEALLAELTGRTYFNYDEDESSSDPEEEDPEICSFYLRGSCKFGDRCKNLHEVPLDELSDEFQEVKQNFFDAMKGQHAEIMRIGRVHNPGLKQKFDAKRRSMENDYELQLYHGTRQANVASICLSGFDPDKAGENSEYLHHGHGVYYTSSAKYAAKDDFQDGGEKVVILADVLVGNYTKGNPNYYSAPKGYDTCVDHMNKPTKYVKFDEYSSYPSYVIYFN